MPIYLIRKQPYDNMLRRVMRLEYGRVDFDELLYLLCGSINGSADDEYMLQDLSFGDAWMQGHTEHPLTWVQKKRLDDLFNLVRDAILRELDDYINDATVLVFIRTDSSTSLCFDLRE